MTLKGFGSGGALAGRAGSFVSVNIRRYSSVVWRGTTGGRGEWRAYIQFRLRLPVRFGTFKRIGSRSPETVRHPAARNISMAEFAQVRHAEVPRCRNWTGIRISEPIL
jgi:hypothetical protein